MKQVHAYFSGKVQGVFFRVAAKDLADNLGLAGFVKNLPDGRVELLAQGEEENLNKLLDELNKNFAINKDSQISWLEGLQDFSDFNIKY